MQSDTIIRSKSFIIVGQVFHTKTYIKARKKENGSIDIRSVPLYKNDKGKNIISHYSGQFAVVNIRKSKPGCPYYEGQLQIYEDGRPYVYGRDKEFNIFFREDMYRSRQFPSLRVLTLKFEDKSYYPRYVDGPLAMELYFNLIKLGFTFNSKTGFYEGTDFRSLRERFLKDLDKEVYNKLIYSSTAARYTVINKEIEDYCTHFVRENSLHKLSVMDSKGRLYTPLCYPKIDRIKDLFDLRYHTYCCRVGYYNYNHND